MPVRLGFLVPFALFAAIATALGVGLTLDPGTIPTVLKGKAVPEFDLPPVLGREAGLASADLRGGGVSVVNVFASWCVPCRIEHPLITGLSEAGISVYGLNHKDRPENAARWLDDFGDPYARTGADLNGRVSIDWGVYGVPETFVVDGQGMIVEKHVGPLTPADIEETMLPAIARAAGR